MTRTLYAVGMTCVLGLSFLLTAMSLAMPARAQSGSASPDALRQVDRPYILSTDDQITITVLGHDDMKADITILPDGTFHYPIVGTVQAAGRTPSQLEQALIKGLSVNLIEPQVTVSVVQSRPRKVSILGAVKMPGLYDVKTGWHLLDALAVCGDLIQAPEMTQATLVTDGGKKAQPVDLVRLIKGGDMSQNVALMPGDVLLVQARDLSAVQVQVSGQVVRPGSYSVPPGGVPILTVLNQAGGPTSGAALTRVQVMHDGKSRMIDLRPLLSRLDDGAGAARLVAGDTLLVPENTAKVAVLGEVRTPALYPVPDGERLPLTTALALAGGTTSDGDKKSVMIARRGPDGKLSTRSINIEDILKGGSDNGGAVLEAGDILFVPTRHKGHSGSEVLQTLSPLSLFATLLR